MPDVNKSMIFHYPGSLSLHTALSASQIRPLKMLDTFRSLKFDVDVVMGTTSQRARQVGQIVKKIKGGKKYEFLYSENCSLPTLLTTGSRLPLHPWLDYRLFITAKRARIPLGVFYRDVYWRFPEYRNRLGLIKSTYAKCFCHLDLWIYRNFFNVVFVPSLAMLDYLPGRFRAKTAALPSGATPQSVPCSRYSGGHLRVLYVGGVTYYYNLRNLYAAVRKLPTCDLTICCRKEEWIESEVKKQFDQDSPPNIRVVHLSGDALRELYAKSHIFALTLGSNKYRTFAMPFKLFEYISYQGPIVCTAGTAAASFVAEKGAGIVVEDSAESIGNTLDSIIASPDILTSIYRNLQTLSTSESWEKRAAYIRDCLTGCRVSNT